MLGGLEWRIPVTASDVIAVCAVVVAVGAFVVTLWQGYEIRKHNRLSARPHLEIPMEFRTSEEFVGAFVVNYGIGPARVIRLQVTVDGERIPGDWSEQWPIAMKQLGLSDGLRRQIFWSALPEGSVIAVGEAIELAAIPSDELTADLLAAFRDALARVGFSLDYESFYGEPFTTMSVDHPMHLLDPMIEGFADDERDDDDSGERGPIVIRQVRVSKPH
jgi:hypothetical protein